MDFKRDHNTTLVGIPGSAGNISGSEKNTISVEIPGSVEGNHSKSENNISNVNLIDLNLDCYVYKKILQILIKIVSQIP